MKTTKKSARKTAVILTAAVTAIGLFPVNEAAAKPKLQKSSVQVEAGKSILLKVKGSAQKAKWTVKSGKKCVRLTAKKNSSVKVHGKKKGTAKIQCGLGKKKLICTVKVFASKKTAEKETPPVNVSLSPTDTAGISTAPAVTTGNPPTPIVSQTPSQEPSPTPYDRYAYELKTKFTPGPATSYDRIQVEVGLHKSYLHPEHIFAPGDIVLQEMQFFATGIWRADIEQLHISDSREVPSDVLGQFDLSEKQNGSVMAWYTDKDGDGKYEMTIGQNGGVIANENSSYLFSQIVNKEGQSCLTGLENLDTSRVTNMSWMFADSEDHVGTFSLGDNFDTSHVTDMTYMFRDFSKGYLEKLYLGAKFDTSAVTDVEFMFTNTGTGELWCYVKDEGVKQWFTAHSYEMRWHIGVNASWEYKPNITDDYFVVLKN